MFKKTVVLSVLIVGMMLFAGPLLTQVGTAGGVADASHAHSRAIPGFSLQLPPFFSIAASAPRQQSTIADYFASGLAGITAYTNVGKGIDIDKLATSAVFQTVEDSQPGEYVIGTVVASGFKDSTTVQELMQVHVFAQREGWIVAYLTPEEPTARIIDWSQYGAKKLNTTTLEDAVQQVAKAASVTAGPLGYYHFSHPDATNLMLVGDTIGDGNPPSDTFSVKVPAALTIYESSFSHSTFGSMGTSECTLDGNQLSELWTNGKHWTLDVNYVDSDEWLNDTPNEVGLEGQASRDQMTNCGIAFVYGEAE